MRLLVTTFILDANLAVLPYEAFPVSVRCSFATTPWFLFHIPLFIFLIQLYLLSSIQPPLFFPPPVSHTRLQPSPHLFLTILLRTLPPRSRFFLFFCFSCPRCLSSPAALCFTDQISGCGKDGPVACAAKPLCASIRGCLHNPHKSPHPPFGLLGKHNGCLSSIQQQIQRR